MNNVMTGTCRILLLTCVWLAGCGGGYGQQDGPGERGAFAYVANASSGTVSVHDLDRATGFLSRAKASTASGNGPVSVAAHTSRTFLYAANFNSADIAEFRVNQERGTLTPLRAPLRTGGGRRPMFIDVHPSGRFALLGTLFDGPTTGQLTAYAIDPQGGALTQVGNAVFAGSSPGSVAFAPSGQFAYVADSATDVLWTFSIDPVTGGLTNLNPDAPASTGAFPVSVVVDRLGRFAYVVNNGSDTVSMFAVDAATGSLARTGGAVATGLRPTSIAVDAAGRFAYVTNELANSLSTYAIDAAGGTLRAIGAPVPTGDGPRKVVLEPTGRYAYVLNLRSNDVSVYAIDPTSGLPQPSGSRVAVGLSPASMAILVPSP